MKPKKAQTLCIVQEGSNLLLGFKKRGLGEGKWNFFGGNVEEGETIEEATRRETLEEAGVGVGGLEKMGIIQFDLEDVQIRPEVHIFKTEEFTGEPQESDEMRPQWFSIDTLPYERMWAADRFWLELLLAGKKFRGSVRFGKGGVLLGHEIEEVEAIL